jgi:hypothetical protein
MATGSHRSRETHHAIASASTMLIGLSLGGLALLSWRSLIDKLWDGSCLRGWLVDVRFVGAAQLD